MYSLPNIVRVVKSRRMRWAGHVACMGEERGVHRVLLGKPEGKRPLGRTRRTRSVNKVMRLIQYNSVLNFKLQIEFVPFKIVPLGGYTPPETLFPIFVATLVVANRNRF